MYVCMCVCVHVCKYACMRLCMHACMHVCMYACMHVCMKVCIYVCIVCVCMYACMYVVTVSIHLSLYVCMHVDAPIATVSCPKEKLHPKYPKLHPDYIYIYIYIYTYSPAYADKRKGQAPRLLRFLVPPPYLDFWTCGNCSQAHFKISILTCWEDGRTMTHVCRPPLYMGHRSGPRAYMYVKRDYTKQRPQKVPLTHPPNPPYKGHRSAPSRYTKTTSTEVPSGTRTLTCMPAPLPLPPNHTWVIVLVPERKHFCLLCVLGPVF